MRRVIIIYITFIVLLNAFFACNVYNWYCANEFVGAFLFLFMLGASLRFLITVFTYFTDFQIIRENPSQVQTNQNAIDIKKYKKSVFTILYINAIVLLSYVPYVCCLMVVIITDKFGSKA